MAEASIPKDTASTALAQEQPGQEITEALRTPTQPKGLGFQLLYGLTNAVIGFGNITFYTILLPARIAMVAPTNQTNSFIAISGIGAVASVITNPLVGAFSDRTTAALGRRRPWLIVSMLLLLISMLILAFAPTLVLVGVGAVLLQVAINALLAALSAIIPDQVPLGQRATVSAFSGMAPLVGGLLGQILVVLAIRDIFASFLALGLISALVILVFTLVLREIRLPRGAVAPFRLKNVLTSFWLNPIKYSDFFFTWLARCLIFLGSTTVINYMNYFLQDGVHYTRVFPGQSVAQGVQAFYTAFVISILVASIVCGILSDKLQRRKPFVIYSSLIMGVGLLLLAFFPVWSAVLIAAVILGIGFGTYLSVDLALASQLVPKAQDRGKDLGLINTAIFLPMLVAPAIAGIALGVFHSYTVLFVVLTIAAALAAVLIIPIKQVR
jgi:MFS family permease